MSTVAVLLFVFGSELGLPTTAVAELLNIVVVPAVTLPETEYVTAPPLGRLTAPMMFPLPLAPDVHVAPPVGAQVQLTPV